MHRRRKCTGRTFDPRQVDLVELLCAEAAQRNHLLHRHALLARRAALVPGAQLLDFGQEALDADLERVRVELGLRGPEPPREDDAEGWAVGRTELDAQLVREDARADEGLDDTQVVMPLCACTQMRRSLQNAYAWERRDVLTTLSLTTREFAHTKTARGVVRGVGSGMSSAPS